MELQEFVLGITEKFSVVYLLCGCFLCHWHIICKITSSTFYDAKSKSNAEENKLPLKS